MPSGMLLLFRGRSYSEKICQNVEITHQNGHAEPHCTSKRSRVWWCRFHSPEVRCKSREGCFFPVFKSQEEWKVEARAGNDLGVLCSFWDIFTSQDDRCSWGVVLGQNSVSVPTCPFPVEFACFPGISIPTTFCFKLPAVQQLAPQISECLTIKSCKLMQVSFNKPREEHVHILPALLLGCCHASAVPGEIQNTGFSVDAYPLHHLCAPPGGNPGSLGLWITSFTSTKDPPSVGSKALSYWEIQYYSAGTFELKITFEKDYPGQSHQLLCTHWT